METVNAITKQVDSVIKPVLYNPYVMAVVKITLALYAAQLAPKLPASFASVTNNTFVKILTVALIAYLAELDLQLAVLLAIVFVIGMNVISGRGMMESFSDFSPDYKPYGNFKLIESMSDIYPGCQNVTMDDLHKAFDGDAAKLQSTAQYAFRELYALSKTKDAKENLMKMAYAVGLPYNIKLDKEENAPFIATLLMYAGFNIGGTCVPPQ